MKSKQEASGSCYTERASAPMIDNGSLSAQSSRSVDLPWEGNGRKFSGRNLVEEVDLMGQLLTPLYTVIVFFGFCRAININNFGCIRVIGKVRNIRTPGMS